MTEAYDPVKGYENVKRLLGDLEASARQREDRDDLVRLAYIGNAVDVIYNLATTNDVTSHPGIRQRDADVLQIKEQRKPSNNLSFYVVALDLDNFGVFNKQHGQTVGDQVLRTTMDILQKGLRDYDVVGKGYHPHGEEIDLILQAPNDTVAALVVNRLRQDLETKSAELSGYTVTGTFGLTPWNIEKEDYVTAHTRADEAMQRGKQEGRNTVRFAPSHDGLAAIVK